MIAMELLGGRIPVVERVQMPARGELLDIIQASDRLRAGLGFVQRRQQHGRQNGDDGDDHQQLDQGEASRGRTRLLPRERSGRNRSWSFRRPIHVSSTFATGPTIRLNPPAANGNSYMRQASRLPQNLSSRAWRIIQSGVAGALSKRTEIRAPGTWRIYPKLIISGLFHRILYVLIVGHFRRRRGLAEKMVGLWFFPALAFHVAVREGETRALVVAIRWHVEPDLRGAWATGPGCQTGHRARCPDAHQ